MPFIETSEFGAIGFEENTVYWFPAGLPGFESATRFVVREEAAYFPLVFLQSVEFGALRFVCAPLQLVDPRFCPELAESDRESLGLAAEAHAGLSFLTILTFPEAGSAPSANLLAPVVLSAATHRGVQSIQAGPPHLAAQPLRSNQASVEAVPCS